VAEPDRPDDGVGGAAWRAAQRAYAPYSRFRVGAAAVTRAGTVFTGCNVENASYSATLCAERNAVAAAVAAEGASLDLVRVVVVTLDGESCAPCGTCRQVVTEFAPDATLRYLREGRFVERSAADLLPDGFEPGDLR
jgi:cytidine deaminase